MNQRAQSRLALTMAAIYLLMFVAVVYLSFIFPKIVAVWQAEGQALTMVERLAVNLSEFCKTYGRVIVPLLLAGVATSIIWALMSARRVGSNLKLIFLIGLPCSTLNAAALTEPSATGGVLLGAPTWEDHQGQMVCLYNLSTW